MKTTLKLLTATLFASALALAQPLKDDFSAGQTPAWQLLAGNGEKGPAISEFKDGTLSLVGSCMQKTTTAPIGLTEFSGEVSFFLTKGAHLGWESAALSLFGNHSAYFMVLFGRPTKKDDICEIGLYKNRMVRKKLPTDKWYTIKVESSEGQTKMKVWEKGTKEPAKWDIQVSIPESIGNLKGVGMRTFGPAVTYDDFSFSSKTVKPITINKNGLKVEFFKSGQINTLTLPGKKPLQFRAGGYHAGPSWSVDGKPVILKQTAPGNLIFTGIQGDVSYALEYKAEGNKLAIVSTMKNDGTKIFTPKAARLMLGINTEMIKYPDWNDKFFPTLIRGEKTHLWGYFMSPKGRVLTISSPDPIASWNYEYQPHRHRIYTVSLDMLHKLPLPARHPQNLTQLKPGEEKSWTIYLEEVDDVKKVKSAVSRTIDAPMFDIDRYTIADGEQSEVSVISGEKIKLMVTDPSGITKTVRTKKDRSGSVYKYTLKPKNGIGQYTLKAENQSSRITEASIYIRHPWSWYLKQARKEAIRIPQKASTHTEAWLGHYSTMAARRYFPDEKLDALAEENFRMILPLMYDVKTGHQIVRASRIQNSYYMFGLLADIYRTTGNEEDLVLAGKIADWLINLQGPDGAYRNGHSHCTSVAYGAKSMLELAAAEKELAKTSDIWKERYERHYNSAKAAIEELELNLDNIETEGQSTYEDGMIGCSATQLAMWALLQDDADERAKFLKAAKYMFDGHRCLDQMIVPDSRYHEGSLRFWEAQYDVMIPRNMMNSPHGWTAWRIPGYYYMYQITGEEEWIRRAMNSLGSCVQLVDGDTGVLRWAFVQDPYVETTKLIEDKVNPDNNAGIRVPTIIGEQYEDMISHFYKPKDFNKVYGGHWGEAGNCDNDVHEIFKALEEVALTAAYVIERADGTLSTYNCTAKKTSTAITIIPAEEVVSRVHLNLKTKHTVNVKFGSREKISRSFSGMQWIGPRGVPEDLRVD